MMAGIIRIFVYLMLVASFAKKIRYVSVERPKIIEANPDYFTNVTIESKRVSRNNPIHYLSLHGFVLQEINNSYLISFYVMQLLTNRYQRSFVEVHYKACEMEKDPFIGEYMTQLLNYQKCPYPGKHYFRLENASWPTSKIPESFPFSKGRLVFNLTYTAKNLVIFSVHVDLEIMEMKVNESLNIPKQ